MTKNHRIYLSSREEWRYWLEKNHLSKKEIWLIYYKKHTGKPRIPYDDAVEEAICFGWIDSLIKRIDEDTYCQKFTPRKTSSSWSELNKQRVKKMIALGRMTPYGLAKVEAAKTSGEWNKKPRPDSLFTMPAELIKALSINQVAKMNFNGFSPATQRNFMGWINSAKQLQTKTNRIEQTVQMAEQNKKLGMK